MNAPFEALARIPFIAWLKANAYAYPALEVVHIIAIAIVFGTLWIVDLRILGMMKALPLAAAVRNLLPWTMIGFALAAITGLTMFATRAGDLVSNSAFLAKMILLMVAGTNAGILHSRGSIDETNGLTRAQAALSLLLWIAIVTCGRWIAYV
ncbi:MAG: DUF6644 family protein [Casimicrobium sp.]